ncbi:MAG: Serine/threonine-protein kinase PknB, partial [Verrucomicrobiota bacterium]
MTTPSLCPKCGATIPDGAPQGLCPKCVLLGATIPLAPPAASHHPRPPTVAELAVHFPDLEVLELIGAGGMGAVYKARQPKLDRLVALKVLSSDLAGDPAFAERFDREARLLARLHHANIVTVFDSGLAGPFAYLMMEFVDGVNLRQAMKAGRFTPQEALTLVQDVCAALKFAHEQGILHRDIKPENILIDSRGQVKIADFGI